MIIQCRNCSKKLKVPDSAAGKKVKCPSCANVIAIPSTSAPDAAAAPAPRAKPRDAGSVSPPARPAAPIGAKPPAAKPSATAKQPAQKPRNSAKPAAADSSTQSPVGKQRPAAKKRPTNRSPAKRRRPPESNPFADDFSDLPYGDDYEDNPYAAPKTKGGKRKGTRGRKSSGLGTVGVGLLVQAWAVTGIILLLVVLFVLLFSGAVSRTGSAGNVFLMGIGAAAIAMLVGELMCLATPAESGAKGLIIGAVCCHGVSFGVNMINRMGAGNVALPIIGGIASLAFFILYLLFLRTIARYAGHDDRATRAMVLLIGMPACWGLVIFVTLIVPALGIVTPAFAFVMLATLFAVTIAMLVLSVMYVALLFGLGSDLRRS